MQNYLKELFDTYQAQMAGAWYGDEQETLDKIEEICKKLNMDVETAFEIYG